VSKLVWKDIRRGLVECPDYLKTEIGWRQAVARGDFEDVEHIHVFGHNTAVGATNEMVWHQGGQYVYLSAPTQLIIASTSANDTAAGSGAQALTIFGLDADYHPIQEDIELNGQTAVTTVQSFIRVHRKRIRRAGATGWNEGLVRSGTGAAVGGVPNGIVTSNIGINFNETLLAMRTVPEGWRGYLELWSATSSITKQVQVQLRVREFGKVFTVREFMSLTVGQVEGKQAIGEYFDPKTDFEIQANAVGGGGAVGASLHLTLERI